MFEIVHDESVNVYPHMYNGNIQQNPLCVQSCVTKEFAISLRFSPTIFYPDANSVLLRAHLCTAVDSMRRKPCVRNVQESVKVCTTGMSSRNLYAQHPVSLRIFLSLPGSRLRFFIAGQIQHPTVHSFLNTPVQIGALCRLEAHYVRDIKLKKCVIVSHSTGPLLRMYSTVVVCSTRRTLRSKLLISRKSVNVFLHIHVQRECSAEETLYA